MDSVEQDEKFTEVLLKSHRSLELLVTYVFLSGCKHGPIQILQIGRYRFYISVEKGL